MASDDADPEDKTEEPSERRLREAIEKGDVPHSADVNTVFILASFALFVAMAAPMGVSVLAVGRGFLGQIGTVGLQGSDVLSASTQFLSALVLIFILPFALFWGAACVGGLVQHQPLLTSDPLMPQLARLSPMKGFERIFGRRARHHAAKGFFRVFVLGATIFFVMWPVRDAVVGSMGLSALALPTLIQDLLLRLLLGALALYACFAVLDYLHEWYEWRQRLRMTREQAKEDRKSDEGHPEVKMRMRQIGLARVRKRMMAAVPDATVVIANPTHFAVALRYEQGMDAPICVAKGVDHLALRIRGLAEDNRVPVIENPPLARALYASVDLDQPIPVEHYRAVAEIIGFVLRLRKQAFNKRN